MPLILHGPLGLAVIGRLPLYASNTSCSLGLAVKGRLPLYASNTSWPLGLAVIGRLASLCL